MKNYSYQKTKRRRSFKMFLILLILLVGVSGLGYKLYQRRQSVSDASLSQQSTETPQTSTDQQPAPTPEVAAVNTAPIRFIAVGDMLPHDTLNARAKKEADYDYMQFMSRMKPLFDKAELRFCNQAVLGGGEAFGITGYPIFNSPTQVQRDMAALGCNIINTGSNHTNDKDQAAIDASVAAWDPIQTAVAVAGSNRSAEEMNKVRYFEYRGVNLAFVSYSTYTNKPNINPFSLTMYSKELAQTQITEARSKADIVIVSMRWGTEYSPEINADQDRIAQELSDIGADIVLGHGPHVMEPVKRLTGATGRETLVWFSLGNFLNAQLDIEHLTACIASMDIDPITKTVTRVTCLPIYTFYEWTAAEKAKGSLLARRNFEMMPLEEAADYMGRNLLNTTVEAQTERIRSIINKYTEVPVIKVAEY